MQTSYYTHHNKSNNTCWSTWNISFDFPELHQNVHFIPKIAETKKAEMVFRPKEEVDSCDLTGGVWEREQLGVGAIREQEQLEINCRQENKEGEDNQAKYFLPDLQVFRNLTLKTKIPSDFTHLVNYVLWRLKLTSTVYHFRGKFYGSILREMISISFADGSLDSKIRRFKFFLSSNQIPIWINLKYQPQVWRALCDLGGDFCQEPSKLSSSQEKIIYYSIDGYFYEIHLIGGLHQSNEMTVNCLNLNFINGGRWNLSVEGSENSLANTLNDIRRKRLISPSEKLNSWLAFELLVQASQLHSLGYRPLCLEDWLELEKILYLSSQILFSKKEISPTKFYRKDKLLELEIYQFILTFDPDFEKLIRKPNACQIKLYYLLTIFHNDIPHMKILAEVTQRNTVYFALETAAILGSSKIFGILYFHFRRSFNTQNLRKCLILALYHQNIEISKYLIQKLCVRLSRKWLKFDQVGFRQNRTSGRSGKADCWTSNKISELKSSYCWHKRIPQSPCQLGFHREILRQMLIDYQMILKISSN